MTWAWLHEVLQPWHGFLLLPGNAAGTLRMFPL
jgi:hypothetical protein